MDEFTPIRTLKDINSTLSPAPCDLTSLRFVEYPTGFTARYKCNYFTASLGLGCQPSWWLGNPSPLPSPYYQGKRSACRQYHCAWALHSLWKGCWQKVSLRSPANYWTMEGLLPDWWGQDPLAYGWTDCQKTRHEVLWQETLQGSGWRWRLSVHHQLSLSSVTCPCMCLSQRLRRPSSGWMWTLSPKSCAYLLEMKRESCPDLQPSASWLTIPPHPPPGLSELPGWPLFVPLWGCVAPSKLPGVPVQYRCWQESSPESPPLDVASTQQVHTLITSDGTKENHHKKRPISPTSPGVVLGNDQKKRKIRSEHQCRSQEHSLTH